MTATIYKADGSELLVSPENGSHFTLGELQEIVGGYIEVHTLPGGDRIVMNEEGKLLGLPVNEHATVAAYNLSTAIVGDVLICNQSLIR